MQRFQEHAERVQAQGSTEGTYDRTFDASMKEMRWWIRRIEIKCYDSPDKLEPYVRLEAWMDTFEQAIILYR